MQRAGARVIAPRGGTAATERIPGRTDGNRLEIWGGTLLSDPSAPQSPHLHLQHEPMSDSADPGGRLDMHLRTCCICGQRLGAGVNRIWTGESKLFVLPAVEPGSWSLVLPEATASC